jgi:VIT1/CCC1 family predicted Fe2+/Mn2+ transporter
MGLSPGQMIAAVSAVALVVSLFLAWGGSSVDIPETEIPGGLPAQQGLSPELQQAAEEAAQQAQQATEEAQDASEVSGWESQNTLDIYLAITAGLVLIGAVMVMTGNPTGLPFAPAAATFLLGVMGTILTVYVLIDIPEGAERKIGIYIATAAIIGVAIGSYLQLRDEVAEGY